MLKLDLYFFVAYFEEISQIVIAVIMLLWLLGLDGMTESKVSFHLSIIIYNGNCKQGLSLAWIFIRIVVDFL